MSKIVGEETRQLSARVDVKDFERIDKIRREMKKKMGIQPQRSDTFRMLLTLGFEAYEAQQKAGKEPAVPAKEKRP